MHTLHFDLDSNPNLQFRIDAFAVPAAARAEFDAAMRRNLAFLETLPGFEGNAGATVRAYYQSIGFEMQAMLARTGITASIGCHRALLPMQ
jgi:hypothetical protein